ncbi:FAD-binding protein [Acrocarpospora corrugata]|uniref:FAD-binding protein n=1 Tax=Acrocarpospora corrugata TaxID=35763 RepID=UPI0012D33FC9|nr:FAD-binding protein [Acrocarpospora corrugata]
MTNQANWAGNLTYSAERIYRPTSVEELRGVVAGSSRIRALGTRHSFNEVGDSPAELVELGGLPPVIEVDSDAGKVRVGAGLRYADVGRYIDERGFGLGNLGSLPHISIAGACATGTHGSGVGNGNLSSAVAGLELVTADGDLVRLDRGDERFEGAVVGMGALGVVVALELDLVPSFQVRQRVYEGLPLDTLFPKFREIVSSAYSVSLFTDWRGPVINQVWVKQREDEAAVEIPGTPADGPRHPVPGMSPESCTEQMDVPGPWFERLPHFRPDRIPSAGDELQSEFMIDAADAVQALAALDAIRDHIHPVLQICEVRTIAADRLWLSPCYQRDSVALHFTWVADTPAVLPVVARIEDALAPFAPRPHWAKIFTTPPDALRPRYDRLPDFQSLAHDLDPTGKFRNPFTDKYLFA